MKPYRNSSLDLLRGYAAICTITVHVSAEYVLRGMNEQNFDASFWVGNFFDSFARVSVPVFVMLSGRFLLLRKETAFEFYRKRFKRILLPFLFWCLFYAFLSSYLKKGCIDLSFVFRLIIEGRPASHIWYLYMLIGLYCFSPILGRLLNTSRFSINAVGVFLLIFGMVYRGFSWGFSFKPFFLFWFLEYLGFYVLGYSLGKSSFRVPAAALILVYVAFSSAVAILTYYTKSFYFYSPSSAGVAIASLALFKLFSQIETGKSKLSEMASLSFGVYLAHIAVLIFFDALLFSKLSVLSEAAVGLPMKVLVVSLFSVILVKIGRKTIFKAVF